ncbi:Centlein [Manis pentadactyla]|nr:Centlein [Manis pentadactyla]
MNLDASFKEQDQALEREAELKPDKEKHQIDLVEHRAAPTARPSRRGPEESAEPPPRPGRIVKLLLC